MASMATRPRTSAIRQVSDAWMAGWNNKDAEALVALIADDLTYDDPAWPTTMRRAADVRAFTSACWRSMPDMQFTEPLGVFSARNGQRAVAPWHMTATFTGPMEPPGFAPTGDRIEIDGVDVFEVHDGKISRLSTYYDMADLMRQTGFMPPRGSRAERAAAKVQSVIAKRRRR